MQATLSLLCNHPRETLHVKIQLAIFRLSFFVRQVAPLLSCLTCVHTLSSAEFSYRVLFLPFPKGLWVLLTEGFACNLLPPCVKFILYNSMGGTLCDPLVQPFSRDVSGRNFSYLQLARNKMVLSRVFGWEPVARFFSAPLKLLLLLLFELQKKIRL